jgi:hypothetical protein
MIFKKDFLERASIYRCWWLYLYEIVKLPKHTYTRLEEADVTSLLNSICNFDFVVTIAIVQMCLAFKKGLSRSLDLD